VAGKKKYLLKLYVSGDLPNSAKAIKDLSRILGDDFKHMLELEVIDIQKDPKLAREHRVLATPTLSRIFPEPAMRIIGDFSDRNQLLSRLGLL